MNRPAALTSVQSLHLVKGEIHTSKYVGSDTANEEEQRYLQQERVKRGGERRTKRGDDDNRYVGKIPVAFQVYRKMATIYCNIYFNYAFVSSRA